MTANPVFHSTVIGLNYKLKRDKAGFNRVVFEDGTNYKPFEVELLSGVDGIMLKNIHMVKRIFAGEIVEKIEHRSPEWQTELD